MAGKSTPYDDDLQDWLKAPENAAEYLTAIIEEDDLDALLLAIRDVARAQRRMATP